MNRSHEDILTITQLRCYEGEIELWISRVLLMISQKSLCKTRQVLINFFILEENPVSHHSSCSITTSLVLINMFCCANFDQLSRTRLGHT